MMKLNVAYDKCVRCGACVSDCAFMVLEKDDSGYPHIREGKTDSCVNCQHCMLVCPKAALSVNGKNPCDSVTKEQMPSPESMMTLMKCRRSFRRYKQENISAADLATLLDTLAYAPTGVNAQKLHFSVLDELDVMQKLRRKVYANLRSLKEKGLIPEPLARFSGMADAFDKGYDPLFRTAPHMLIVSCPPDIPCPDADPFIALSYFELLAQSMNIGTVWCGLLFWTFSRLMPEMLPELGIPEGYQLKYVMLFGIPDVRYPRGAQRGPVSMNRIIAI